MSAISVLMPSYNAAAHVRAAVRSATSQLGPRDELVVQDACSTDGTAELLAEAAVADPRVRVRHERDSGQSQALNRGLDRARGELVGWLNADDLLLPGALAAVRAAVERLGHVPDVVVGGWRLLGASGAVIRAEPALPLARGRLFTHGCYAFSGAVFVRRGLLRAIGGYAEHLHYTMDYDLMLRLVAAEPEQLVVEAPLAALRYHDESKSGAAGRHFFTEALSVRKGHCDSAGDLVRAAAGTLLHGVGVATARLRFSDTYSRLRLGRSL
ncbi:glycosyltransferase [Actinokineospora sp. NBRC 105648]|uniref:glycosyltransferase n=1 Tax=Actinokineospora sp. NBRC 105648 TaxID=3032206 RepID=UPI0024A1E95F|nr:glycosyltransferase [Actinokineospora sp. NBRC 105648]GLZ41874.1 hypothetical protein Acsp05_54980 [Actinokineospora sp. NBRC 105648]